MRILCLLFLMTMSLATTARQRKHQPKKYLAVAFQSLLPPTGFRRDNPNLLGGLAAGTKFDFGLRWQQNAAKHKSPRSFDAGVSAGFFTYGSYYLRDVAAIRRYHILNSGFDISAVAALHVMNIQKTNWWLEAGGGLLSVHTFIEQEFPASYRQALQPHQKDNAAAAGRVGLRISNEPFFLRLGVTHTGSLTYIRRTDLRFDNASQLVYSTQTSPLRLLELQVGLLFSR